MPVPTALDQDRRAESWRRLAEEDLDVLVIGGGVTGAGVALDAATRGLRVALVEQRDFASGTSSRSSKLFHGGVRYLEQLNFGLVREALKERELMLTRIAPHLVKPVSFLYPLTHPVWERPYVTAGLTLYDTMGGGRSVPRTKQLTKGGVRRLVPGLKPESHHGGLLYHDAQCDDARHTLTVVRTASAYGATVLNSAKVTGLLHAGERVVGAKVLDVETGGEVEVNASVVINCAGVWTDDIQRMAGGRGRFHVRASKGVHLVVARDRINSESGLILRTEKSVLFCIPWNTHWIIGTTDTDWNLSRAHPAATSADIDYLLEQINGVLLTPLTRNDIQGVYAGLRPLLAGESEESSQLSREHAVARPQPGLISIAGGKYTTYRVMAEDAVDAAREDLSAGVPDSVTEHIPLVGAEGYQALVNQIDSLSRRHDLPGWRITHLLDRYGSLAVDLFALIDEDRTLAEPLTGAEEYLTVEVVYAARHEATLHLNDVLTRRTRISIETTDRGVEAARPVGRILAAELGWDAERTESEVQHYLRRVQAEIESQQMTEDERADAERTEATDIRTLAKG